MTQDDYKAKKKAGEITLEAMGISAPEAATAPRRSTYELDDFIPIIVELLSPKQHLTAAPTFTPRNLLESIQLYDDGVDRRIYVFINDTWRYSTLT